MARGRFITLEGGEGAGKSTQARVLAERLEKTGLAVTVTREPGGSSGGEEIRRLLVEGAVDRWTPMSEALLHYAARVDHVARLIEPDLADGRWVISDRFSDSTLAYQGFGHELGFEAMLRLHQASLGDFRPDVTVVLDLPVDVGLARAQTGGAGTAREDRYERMGTAFHERLRQGFLHIAARFPERCVVVDATQDVDAVAEDIWRAVRDTLKVDEA